MAKVVVIGGGLGGCTAALTARKAGVQVEIVERMDFLSGLAPWTGQILTWVSRTETRLMESGTADIVAVMESLSIHRTTEFGVKDGNITFDVTRIANAIAKLIEKSGIKFRLKSRVTQIDRSENKVRAVITEDGTRIEGDAFVDATGRTGGVEWCDRLGQGCALCLLNCPLFGDRISLSALVDVPDQEDRWNYFPMSLIAMESLSPDLRQKIEDEESGYSYFPIPEDLLSMDFTKEWRRPDRPVTAKIKGTLVNVVHVPFAKTKLNLPLKWLQRIPGFENAWMMQPLDAEGQTVGTGFYASHDDTLRVTGMANLFAAGLRAGRYSGFIEAMFAGDVAGWNAARTALGMTPLPMPISTLMGYFLSVVKTGQTPNEWSGTPLSDPTYKNAGFDTTDYQKIKERVRAAGMEGIFAKRLA
ncbi:MAG: FAD-dependent oxidoreductase [Chloroflexi bacterium]|nr:FAD-dependent oxidoreductase [Chloroflexota bacterium]